MSPGGFMFVAGLQSVPRASGDEPAVVTLDHCSPVCSPRERG